MWNYEKRLEFPVKMQTRMQEFLSNWYLKPVSERLQRVLQKLGPDWF